MSYLVFKQHRHVKYFCAPMAAEQHNTYWFLIKEEKSKAGFWVALHKPRGHCPHSLNGGSVLYSWTTVNDQGRKYELFFPNVCSYTLRILICSMNHVWIIGEELFPLEASGGYAALCKGRGVAYFLRLHFLNHHSLPYELGKNASGFCCSLKHRQWEN